VDDDDAVYVAPKKARGSVIEEGGTFSWFEMLPSIFLPQNICIAQNFCTPFCMFQMFALFLICYDFHSSTEAVVVEKSDSDDDGGAAQRALEEANQT
jgi:hypothetical protein